YSSSRLAQLAQTMPSAVAPDLAAELGQVCVVFRQFLLGRLVKIRHLPGPRLAAGRCAYTTRCPCPPGKRDLLSLTAALPGWTQFIPDRLHPEDHAEDREDGPLEGINPAQRVAAERTAKLPVAQPDHPDHRSDGEQMPAEPPGRQQDPPARR